MGRQIHILEVNTGSELEAAFETLSGLRAGGLVVAEAFFSSRSEQLAALTTRYALPEVYQFRDFATAGGLSYGANNLDAWRLAGITTAGFSRASMPAICRSSNRTRSNWLSISRPPRPSGSRCLFRCLDAPTRSSNNEPFAAARALSAQGGTLGRDVQGAHRLPFLARRRYNVSGGVFFEEDR